MKFLKFLKRSLRNSSHSSTPASIFMPKCSCKEYLPKHGWKLPLVWRGMRSASCICEKSMQCHCFSARKHQADCERQCVLAWVFMFWHCPLNCLQSAWNVTPELMSTGRRGPWDATSVTCAENSLRSSCRSSYSCFSEIGGSLQEFFWGRNSCFFKELFFRCRNSSSSLRTP